MSSQKRKFTKRFIKILIIVFLILNIHYLILSPLKIIWFPSIKKNGISYYSNKEYLYFEDGDKFERFANNLEFIDSCGQVDFCYFNNCLNDNLYFGKSADFFTLDLIAEKELYYEIKGDVLNRSYYYGELRNYEYYELTDLTTYSELYMILFCDDTFSIRCVMITSLNDAKYYNGYTLIGTHLPEWWKSKNVE